MTDIEKKVEHAEEKVEHAAHNFAHPEDETDKEAKKRQPWMPIVGSIIAGALLFAILYFYAFA